jgi:hypothetical protein
MKTEVYSWRVSSDIKTGLEREARRRKISMAAALDLAAREWLQHSCMESAGDEGQRQLHKDASRWLGAVAGGNPQRSQTASETVRQRLRQRYGR